MIRNEDFRPWITISYAQSLDGRLATKTGDSQWISGPESLQFTHELRNSHEGILVGIGTVLKDDPRLTCRIPQGRDPIRIILDSQLRIPSQAQVLTASSAPTWIYTNQNSLGTRKDLDLPNVEIIPVACEDSRELPLAYILKDLRNRGMTSLFVEGGAQIITNFLKQGFFDRLAVVTAPLVIGEGVSAIGDLGVRALSSALIPKTVTHQILGKDRLWDLLF